MSPGSVVFARYQLHEQIGVGGAGVVWSATDQRLDQPVALKCIAFAAVGDQPAQVIRDRALREARLAAQLRGHPNVVNVYDVLDDNNDVWLVMEYLPAQSLSQLLATHHRLDVVQVARIGARIANALAAAHDRGIEHRDVKPGNILIGTDGTVKLTDFGISHLTGDPRLTQTGISGTPAYLAPEVADRGESSPASDMFSLGATLYAAVEGQPPFGTDDNILRLLNIVRTGIIRPPTNAGPLEPLLLRLLQLNPTTRPDATTTRDFLIEFASRLTAATEPIHSTPRLKPAWWPPRQRSTVAIGSLAALTAGALVAINALTGSTGGTPNTAPSGAGPVVSDLHHADPCQLISVRALNSYGQAEISPSPPVLEGCQAKINTQAGTTYLRVNFDNPQSVSELSGATKTVDGMTIVAEGSVDSYEGAPACRQYVVLAGAPLIVINSFSHSNSDMGLLCNVAEAATGAAIEELKKRGGTVPLDMKRNAEFVLARVVACDTLGRTTVSKVYGLDSTEPKPGFADWSCTWGTKESATRVEAYFRIRNSFEGLDGIPTKIAEKEAFRTGRAGNCDIYVTVKQHPTPSGTRINETLHLAVAARLPEEEACKIAEALADTAVRSLPNN